MFGRIVLAIGLVLALIAGVAGLGWYAYTAGMATGLGQAGAAVAPTPPYGPFVIYPFGFAMELLGCLLPLLVVALVFALVRPLFWRGHRGFDPRTSMRPGSPHMAFGPEGWRRRCREMAEEWHRQAHGGEPSGPMPGEPSRQT